MIGDSITCDGRWWCGLREQLLARAPALRCDFRNCGIPGGTVVQALRRYDWDIAPHKATLAFVMFGMNDIGRGDYNPNPTAATLAARAESFQRYLAGMDSLTERLLEDRTRVILLTPTPFDQYAPTRPAPNLPGLDDALAVAGGMIQGIARARRLPLIDLHTPLRQRCAALETLIWEDRVHPNDRGHEAMCAVVAEAMLPGAAVPVPETLQTASRALHAAEERLRTIATFRCKAEEGGEGTDDNSVLRYIEDHLDSEPNLWLKEQMRLCREFLPQQAEMAEEVKALRKRLSAAIEAAR